MLRLPVTILFLVAVLTTVAIPSAGQQRTITIQMPAQGNLSIDRIPVHRENLPREVQQRLWRSYMSNGKMLQSIRLEMDSSLPEAIRTDVLTAIRKGREQTLTILSLHKHKKRFEDIGSRKQEKIRKQFPVLFRNEYDG